MLVWWHELVRDLVGGSLAILHLYEEMMILDLKMKEAVCTRGTEGLRCSRLVSRPQP